MKVNVKEIAQELQTLSGEDCFYTPLCYGYKIVENNNVVVKLIVL